MSELVKEAIIKTLQQGKPAFDKKLDMCMYRTDDGNKCAVGQLIPEDKYSRTIEGVPALYVLTRFNIGTNYEKHLLSALQHCHDSAAKQPTYFIEAFIRRIESNPDLKEVLDSFDYKQYLGDNQKVINI